MMLRRQPLKRGRGNRKTAAEERHMNRVAAKGCCICGGEATLHHVTSDGYKRIARTHERVIPLCPRHHLYQHGPRESIEALGHEGFYRTYGIHPLTLADLEWAESAALERRAA
jgi:hypothetical protein